MTMVKEMGKVVTNSSNLYNCFNGKSAHVMNHDSSTLVEDEREKNGGYQKVGSLVYQLLFSTYHELHVN